MITHNIENPSELVIFYIHRRLQSLLEIIPMWRRPLILIQHTWICSHIPKRRVKTWPSSLKSTKWTQNDCTQSEALDVFWIEFWTGPAEACICGLTVIPVRKRILIRNGRLRSLSHPQWPWGLSGYWGNFMNWDSIIIFELTFKRLVVSMI